MRIGKISTLAFAALLFLSACNMPGGPDAASVVQTAAAETVSAQQTVNAQMVPTSTNTPLPTATLAVTSTPLVSNTPFATSTTISSGGGVITGNSCDSIQFVSDVTIPDGEDMAADATFTKTWRIRNAGSCTWSTSYSIVFVSGNAMGGNASQALTTSVAPGATTDISVNMKAPSTNGSYTGYWAIRNASNQNFGSFYVQIDVTSGGSSGSTGPGTTVNLNATSVGQVQSDGTVAAGAHAGDTAANTSVQGFVAFNISGIPSNATIEEVTVNFSNYATDSNPFAGLGCLAAYPGVYFPLDAADYSVAGSGADMQWCDGATLSTSFIDDDAKDTLQAALGDPTLEYQLRFSSTTDNDNAKELVRFLGMTLTVRYTTP
jgi:hypothetical protein